MAISRKCDECRNAYVAKRNDSRFCSAACRQRASRKTKTAEARVLELVVDEPVDEAGDADASRSARGDVSRSPVTDATRAELEAAGRIDTSLGQTALVMARRIDSWTSLDTGSSLASAAKALRDLMAEATRGRAVEDDPVEELRRRREARRRGA